MFNMSAFLQAHHLGITLLLLLFMLTIIVLASLCACEEAVDDAEGHSTAVEQLFGITLLGVMGIMAVLLAKEPWDTYIGLSLVLLLSFLFWYVLRKASART
jgi:NADH:ubiquinone oxidoreductase subunit 2 (subunit N)